MKSFWCTDQCSYIKDKELGVPLTPQAGRLANMHEQPLEPLGLLQHVTSSMYTYSMADMACLVQLPKQIHQTSHKSLHSTVDVLV